MWEIFLLCQGIDKLIKSDHCRNTTLTALSRAQRDRTVRKAHHRMTHYLRQNTQEFLLMRKSLKMKIIILILINSFCNNTFKIAQDLLKDTFKKQMLN